MRCKHSPTQNYLYYLYCKHSPTHNYLYYIIYFCFSASRFCVKFCTISIWTWLTYLVINFLKTFQSSDNFVSLWRNIPCGSGQRRTFLAKLLTICTRFPRKDEAVRIFLVTFFRVIGQNFFLSCLARLNRWPFHSRSQWLTDFWFQHIQTSLQRCRRHM